MKILFGFPFASPPVDDLPVPGTTAALPPVGLSRQVGAVIATSNGEILSTGSNEVLYPGGGGNMGITG
jgi:hypothetical protein